MIIPRPAELTPGQGRFVVGPTLRVNAGRGAGRAADLLAEYVGPPPAAGGAGPAVHLELVPGGGPEAYRLSIRPDGVRLTSAGEAGLLHGVQTLRQLLPRPVLDGHASPVSSWWPALEIVDRPRLAWRGVLLDVARHFLPLEFLRAFVDQLALHKLNVLQLHLTDDQGWRLEVPGWPRLTSVGAWRTSSPMGSDPSACSDGTPHGGYYTAAELRTLVEYAACRGVTIVPEIEMPGHVRAALAAYPELGNHPDRTLPVWDRWGVCPDILNVEEATLQFCREVLSHVADVFPSRYIHLGGDECPTGQWEDSVAARRRAAGLGLDRPAALHGWFLEQMVTHLDGLGRRAVAWDETGHASGRLPRRLALTAWRDAAHAAEAIGHGHQVVMAPHRFTYFDYPQSDHPHEPAGQPGQTVTLADVYGFDPLAGRLTAVPTLADDSPGVLGTQANLWTEYAPTPDQVSYLAYPRLCALAEVAWSTPPLDLYAFQGRLNAHQRRLGAAGAIRRPAARSGRRMVVGGD